MTNPVTQRLSPDALPGLHTASMVVSDGIRLDADVWMPPGEQDAPVLLMRQAYGRRLGSTLCYAHPDWYARQGFIVVVQDVRGRGTSQGTFSAFEHEARDGYETVEWAARLPRSNGNVGMFGFSYQGTNQLLAASLAPPSLKAMAPAMVGWDILRDWAGEGEAMRLQSNLAWAIQMAAGTAAHQGERALWDGLFCASRNIPSHISIDALSGAEEKWGKLPCYSDWVEREQDDPYWDRLSPSASCPALRKAAIPALFVGAWFDTHLGGTLEAFEQLRGSSEVSLLVGPWTHFPWGRYVAEVDFGPVAISPVDHMQVRWFKRWLMADRAVAPLPTISLFDLGTCLWRDRPTWSADRLTFALGGSAVASVRPDDGGLVPPAVGNAEEEQVAYLVHDPWRPAPSVGGAFGIPAGPVERRHVDSRTDVLTFTSEPLARPVSLFGAVAVELDVICDAVSFDLCCVLSRIDLQGRTMQIAEGYACCREPAGQTPVHVSLRRTCATLSPGEQLRLSISAASFPAYPVNPGNGERPITASRFDAKPVTLGIRTGGRCGSLLHLEIDNETENGECLSL